MVVVGSRGLAGFTELLVGSTVVQLVSHAPCPVVVVRSLPYLTPGDEAGRVIVGVDGSPSSDETLAFAFEEASLRGQGLTAVHAWHVPFMEVPSRGDVYDVELAAGVEAESRSHVAGALAPWRDKYPDVDVRQLVVHGDPVQTIVEASTGAALTVVGSRGRGGFRNLLLGSVSHGVVHHARSAVAVVRPRS
jgi:nucleotide-binding universal stress UspA family protein